MCASAKPADSLSVIGPDALARRPHDEMLPNGAENDPVQRDADGRAVAMLTRPPSVFRPNSALCGPRTNSICPISSSSRLDELVFNCGTPSM